MTKPVTEGDVKRILSNPFYAIQVDESMCVPHETLISEEDWIKSAVKLVEEIGVEEYMKNLLENLKGNYVT